jgi:hypothetical protein
MGELLANGDVIQNENYIRVDTKILTGGKYVGGLNGYSEGQKTYTANDNTVKVGDIRADGISGNASYAGGLYGLLKTQYQIDLLRDNVAAKSISGISQFIGGFAGWIYDYNEGMLVEDGVVTVDNYIKGWAYVSGMFGYSQVYFGTNPFYVNSAKVTTPLIQATDGYVGGIHGYALTGQFNVGYYDRKGAYRRDYVVNIQVDKMAGAYAVGGVVGVNHATSNLAQVFVNAGPSTTKKPSNLPYYTQVIVNVKNWANTQTAEYFGTNDVPMHYGGTFGNILGMMHGNLYIDELMDQTQNDLTEIYTLPSGHKMGYLVVHDNLLPDVKAAVLYRIHNDQYHNVGVDQFYWGDGNGYLGWNATQQYYIDGVQQRSEQLDMGPERWAHNIFLKDEADDDPDAGYDSKGYYEARTKLQAESWPSVQF